MGQAISIFTEAVNAYITAVTVDKVALIVGPPVANIANAIKETSESYDVPVVGLAMDPACQLKDDGTPYAHMFCLQPNALRSRGYHQLRYHRCRA